MTGPASAQSNRWKVVLVILVLAAGLALVVSRFLQAITDRFNPSRDYDMPLTARITGVEMNR